MPQAKREKDPEVERVLFERGLSELEERIGHSFVRKRLLRQAMTHSSFAMEDGKESYERLEFLGDRVLELAVSDWLFHNRGWDEGQLSKTLAWLVDEESLASAAEGLRLDENVRLGKSFAGRMPTSSVLADAFEALLGALYVDAGFGVASRIVMVHVLMEGDFGPIPDDYFSRSTLEERCRKGGLSAPTFSHQERGPEHEKEFECTVTIDDGPTGKGVGRTKKEAERKASAELLKKLG